MKVNRRRTLFYQRRTSNIYRLFTLAILILAGGWLAIRLHTGEIRSPFSPTPTSTRTINSFVLEGDAFFDAGNLNAAITAYQQATQVDASNPQVWAKLARIQTYSSRLLSSDVDRLARLTEALKSADQAIALAPDDSDVLAIHAFVLDWNADPALDSLRSGGQTAAKIMFNADQEALHAIQQNGQNALALAFYAEILIDQQKWTQAEQYILQAVNLGPQMMDVHRVYGYYLESIGDYRQAIEEYQNALRINPNLTFLYISIGQNYRILAFRSPQGAQQNELYTQANANFGKAITINDQLQIKDPLPYVAIANTYAQEGQFFASALNAQKAVELDPTNADLYGKLGNIYKRGRNYETAIIALKCAVRGCTPAESCTARNGCPVGDAGVQVQGLALNPNSATYYLDDGSVLSAFAPPHPEYCPEVNDILTQLVNTYPDNTIITRNANAGLAICSEVSASLTQTSTPNPKGVSTSTPVYTLPTPVYTP
jgi:tetratricopeptide (TPR) repeat protein